MFHSENIPYTCLKALRFGGSVKFSFCRWHVQGFRGVRSKTFVSSCVMIVRNRGCQSAELSKAAHAGLRQVCHNYSLDHFWI